MVPCGGKLSSCPFSSCGSTAGLENRLIQILLEFKCGYFFDYFF